MAALFQNRCALQSALFLASIMFVFVGILPCRLSAQQRLRALQEQLGRFRETEDDDKNEQIKLSAPHERLLYEIERIRDPRTSALPENIKTREYDFAASLPDNTSALSPSANSRTSKDRQTALHSLVWQNIGPGNVGGRTRAFAFDIENQAIMLAGGVSGGMWRSLDSGASWVRVSAPNEIANISCLAQDPRPAKRRTWYYGTGELLSTTDRRVTTQLRTIHAGNGLFKSTDNGASWKPLRSTLSSGGNNSAGKPTGRQLTEFFNGVWSISPDPARQDSDIVLAACYGGILRSNDGGASWTLVLGNAATKAWCADIVATPQGTFYAALGTAEDGTVAPEQGVWRSEDGIKWIRIGTIAQLRQIRRIRLALAPSNPNALYVFAEAPTNWATRFTNFAAQNTFLRYTHPANAAQSGVWEDRSAFLPRYLGTLAGYAVALAVHPTDENIVVLGGTDLYVTRDGGRTNGTTVQSWRQIGGYPYTMNPQDLHPDMHHAVFSRSSPNLVFVANDGGISSTDITSRTNAQGLLTWKLRTGGLVTSQFYYIALDRLTRGSNVVIGGLQDNSCFFTTTSNPTQGWTWAFGGDGMSCAVLKTPQGAQGHNFAVSSQYGFLYNVRTNAAGNAIANFWWTPPDNLNGEALISSFCTLFVIEPTTSKELYIAMLNRLVRYNDLAAIPQDSVSALADNNWFELRSPRMLIGNSIITALGISTSAPQHRIFAGTNDGRIVRIDRANEETQTVRDVTSALFPQGGFISSISVDSRNGNRVLVAFSNYNIQSLFVSDNGGETWTAVGGNLEESPDGTGAGPSVRCVKIVNTTDGKARFYAGTAVGLFGTDSLKGMATEWRREGATTIGNVMVEHLDARESDGRIVVATHGNGVYQATLGVEEPPVTAFVANELYPNPASDAMTLRLEIPSRQRIRAVLYNALGQEIATLFDDTLDDGIQFLNFDLKAAPFLSLSSDKYFCRIQGSDSTGDRFITKQMLLLRK